MEFIALDFETANNGRDSICQIGAVHIKDGKIYKTYNQLIKPNPNRFDWINTDVHGIDEDMVKDAPTFKQAYLDDFKDFIEGHLVVCHNTAFDMYVLNDALKKNKLEFPNIHYVCSYRLAQRLMPQQNKFGLAHLSNYLNVEFNHHDALSDALACAHVYQHLATLTDLEIYVKKCYKIGKFSTDGHNPFLKK